MKTGRINYDIVGEPNYLEGNLHISNEILDDISEDLSNDPVSIGELQCTNQDSFSMYLKDINQYKLMTDEEVEYYGKKLLEGDAHAREKFITHNLKYVVNVAKSRLPLSPLLIDDLVSAGNFGLIRAAGKYDFRRAKFTSLAKGEILAAMIREEENQSRTIRISVHMVQKRNKVNHSIERLTQTLGRTPNPEEISKDTGIKLKDVLKALDASTKMYSIDNMVGSDSEDEGSDYLKSDYDLESECLGNERANLITMALAELSDDEKSIIQLKFFERRDPKSICEILKLEMKEVKSLEKQTMVKLKEALLDLGIDTAILA